jgi:alpha-L-fucosidase 2
MLGLPKLQPIYIGILLISSSYAQVSDISNYIDSKKFDPSVLLWYNQPASKWEDALPVGNGRLGAMVFGKTDEERIQLNEDTYWTGGPYSTVVKGGYKMLPEIQKKVFEGKMLEAHNLFGRYLMGYPVEQQKYQCLANLLLSFGNKEKPANYKRWLDLEKGICSIEFTINGVTYHRDIFSSYPDNLLVIRMTSNKPGSISLKANLRGVRNQAHSNYATDYFKMDGEGKDELVLKGKSADYMGIAGKLRYEARVKAFQSGGTMKLNDVDLVIENADTVTLYFTAATNFVNYKDVSANEHDRVESFFKTIEKKSYEEILETAVTDYRELFKRVSLHLGTTENSYLPTNERLEKIQIAADPSLAALCYQFARYIMISSSRPGTEPANLQGIWNQDMNPAWDSKYTTNINLQMNYWPVETANLPECAEPLIRMVKELSDQGAQVAREHYGCKGWVFHQNTDIWRVAAPMDGPTWGTFTTGGAWLCTQLWEHYLFSMDTNYLKQIYPTIKGSVQFFMDFLVEDPRTKWLVTNPSTSPENFPGSPGNGPYFDEVTGSMLPGTTICAGSSIDMEIISDLFNYFISAAKTLGVDQDFAEKAATAKASLRPPLINKDSALQEWSEDWSQLEKQHRHLSPLYGLYPGNMFSPDKTPQFINACKKLLEERGDEGPGFSRTWKMALWARLLDGNRADKLFKGYIKNQCFASLFAKGGTQFQVDAVFGAAAAITEMLVQSQDGVIRLLPALPDEWSEGEMDGILLRGGFELKMKWENKRIVFATLKSKAGQTCRIYSKTDLIVTCLNKTVKTKKMNDGTIAFWTNNGNVYTITEKK